MKLTMTFIANLILAAFVYMTKGWVLMLAVGALELEGVIPFTLGFWQTVMVVIAAGSLLAWDQKGIDYE